MIKILNFSQLRYQSTANLAILPQQLKCKRGSKKYAALSEANQSDITLNKLQKIKQTNGMKVRSYYKLNDSRDLSNDRRISSQSIDNIHRLYTNQSPDERVKLDPTAMIEDLHSSGVSDPASIIKSTSLLNSFSTETLKKELEEDDEEEELETSKKKRKLAESAKKRKGPGLKNQPKINNLQIQAHKESLTRTLYAYLRVCIVGGMIGRAYHTVMYYRKRLNAKPFSVVIKDITLYDILLQAYASRGNLKKVKELLEIIKQDQLEMTVNTYAAIFECFGIINNPSREKKFLSKIHANMLKQNITFDDILINSRFKLNQYSNVLKGIAVLEPSFKSKPIVKDESYNCHLLNQIVSHKKQQEISAENRSILYNLKDSFKRQLANEIHGSIDIKSIEKIDQSKIIDHYKKEVQRLESQWRKTISEAFDRDLKALKNREHKPIPNSMVLYPCLSILDKEEYITATLLEIRKLATGSENYSPSLSTLCRRLGKYINDKYELVEKQNVGYVNVLEKVYEKYYNWYINGQNDSNNRTAWQRLSDQLSPHFSLEYESVQWPSNLQISVGKFLYDIILKDIKVEANSLKTGHGSKRIFPAFYSIYRYNNSKHLVEEIKPHPVLSKIYRESKPETLTFETTLTPSECPPRPWSSIDNGGYLLLKTDFVRLPLFVSEQMKRLVNTEPKNLWPSLDCLNQLASIPWKVNKPILDIAIDVFRNGGCDQLTVPRPPSILSPPPLLRLNSTEADRKVVIKARLEYKRRKNEMFSLWCDTLYRLSLANHFRDKIFWLPHNMDFRGRVYPVPPHLNHLGADLARSLLIFAMGKPLGPNGLNWLKIHAINLTGLKKRNSIEDRLKYANEILDDIIDSAEKPMTGRMWWKQSEEPWQTLATCKEIAAALKTPNPEEYICNFPIHQDGSCNGLQHYAALGRDQIGAESVNLYPSDKPQDVYTDVVAKVEELRRKDAESGVEIAKVLENFVKRKIIKQTVMTTVYGVTKFGARLQIARQLKDLDDFPQEYVWIGSLYLAQKTFESLRTMFESAKKIQDWFTECAKIISKNKAQNIEWVTPLGLPIVQPYSRTIPAKTSFKDSCIDAIQKPNTSKQKNAFAPNFIHSLDSCHMMLTSIHCEHEGITFVSVHDCFWTHPCSVEIMNKICRQQFVALHSEPILENLSEFFVKKYIDNIEELDSDNDDEDLEKILTERKLYQILTSVPKKGTFQLEKVLESTYFFS
ncbi:DNA-directed RNA polymerase, mitochondrial [Chelonus insularis]|uniref:DNA-directed RNA polymerase, mitochondrial n=1 Tax=Chelonus insularis TaxID=460826 RepID=UPI00158A7B6F|nr:DNA-directed RNA polymerase, mitochondrial [Chelonus insularis]